VQWVGLASSAVLCLARPWLVRLGDLPVALFSYALIVLVTGALTGAVHLWVLGGEVMHWGFLARNVTISAIIGAVALRYFYVQRQWKRNLESEAQARIQALQSRIRPHFLFNSMNTIASLTRSQPELAERAVEDLADLFRVSLSDARVPVTLERELQICRQYLEIESLRLGSRLHTEWAVNPLTGEAALPALSLQPLVENAIYHGIEPATSGGVLRIATDMDGDSRVAVSIRNAVPRDGTNSPRQGNGMAQANVRERMQAFFGGQARFETGVEDEEYWVSLVFPYRSHTA